MSNAFRALYRFWAALLFVDVLVQIGLAGYGVFFVDHKADQTNAVTSHQFDHGFGPHIALGFLILIAGIVLFLFALVGRIGRRGVLLALSVPLLVLVADVLAITGSDTPAVGLFHPVVGFGIVALVGLLAHGAWAGRTAQTS